MTAARQPPGAGCQEPSAEALVATDAIDIAWDERGRKFVATALDAFAAAAVAAERERLLAELSRRYNERYAQAEAEGQSHAGNYLRARGRELTEIEGWLRWKGLAP